MQRLSGSNLRSQAPPRDEDRAGQAPRQPQPGRHRVLLLTMTDYARYHAQLPQVRGALAGDLGPVGRGERHAATRRGMNASMAPGSSLCRNTSITVVRSEEHTSELQSLRHL